MLDRRGANRSDNGRASERRDEKRSSTSESARHECSCELAGASLSVMMRLNGQSAAHVRDTNYYPRSMWLCRAVPVDPRRVHFDAFTGIIVLRACNATQRNATVQCDISLLLSSHIASFTFDDNMNNSI